MLVAPIAIVAVGFSVATVKCAPFFCIWLVRYKKLQLLYPDVSSQ